MNYPRRGIVSALCMLWLITVAARSQTATTQAPTGVTDIAATLRGVVNPASDSASSYCTFEYGTDASYGQTVTADIFSVIGTSPIAVAANPPSLLPDTTYHYRVVMGLFSGGGYLGNDMESGVTSVVTIAVAVREFEAVVVSGRGGDPVQIAVDSEWSVAAEDRKSEVLSQNRGSVGKGRRLWMVARPAVPRMPPLRQELLHHAQRHPETMGDLRAGSIPRRHTKPVSVPADPVRVSSSPDPNPIDQKRLHYYLICSRDGEISRR